MIRGVSDDFWATFVDPDPDSPAKRVVTVWGQGKVNVNTANGQTILAIVCGGATPGTPLCTDPSMQATFLTAMTMAKGFTMGAPLFSSPKGFINAVKGKGMVGTMLAALNVKPVTLLSETETMKAVATESKVFSIYATGVVKAGKRETRVRVHAVVDFRGAPPPGAPPGTPGVDQMISDLPGGPAPAAGQQPPTNLPEGATEAAIAGAFQPSPAGNIIYYRID
jgi:general secretion pathway protein K